ncbi:allene oxide cyclase barrel-like domain-containing protein [Streptomyces fagopyri]|uniref:allene oxide cyclase barrel-like domain-containing protein n=1 Tax=Streptomyces fagopyri TaxID=2662397 RepID=UPI0033C4DD80
MRKFRPSSLSAAVGLAAVLLSTAPAASAAWPAGPSASDTGRRIRQHTEIIQVVAKQTRSENVDVGKKGLSPGDGIVIAEDLYRDGKKIGDHSVVCTYILTKPGELQCLGTFALPQGQITSQALLHLPATGSVDIAVTGGTGDYRSARGFVHTVPAGTHTVPAAVTERRLTFHIIVDDQQEG